VLDWIVTHEDGRQSEGRGQRPDLVDHSRRTSIPSKHPIDLGVVNLIEAVDQDSVERHSIPIAPITEKNLSAEQLQMMVATQPFTNSRLSVDQTTMSIGSHRGRHIQRPNLDLGSTVLHVMETRNNHVSPRLRFL